jgi:hypothetical protein
MDIKCSLGRSSTALAHKTHSLPCIIYSHFKLQVGKLLETREKSLQNSKEQKTATPSGTSTPNGWKLSKGVDNFVVEDIDKVRNITN